MSDLVVVPTATTAADMERTWATLDLATQIGTRAAVLLVKILPGTRSLAAALEALGDEHTTVLDASIPQREALAVVWGQPLTQDPYGDDRAAAQIKKLVHA